MARSSINFAKASKGGLRHNDRTEKKEPEYLLPKEFRQKNEVDISSLEAEQKIKNLFMAAKKNYQKKFGQKLQARSYIWEAVVNLNKNHSLQDIQRLAKEIEKETGFSSVQIAIHRDEGRIERGVPIYNYHAHLTFFTLDRKTGQQLYRRAMTEKQKKEQPALKPMNRARLSKIQTLTANCLGMERGKVSLEEEAKKLGKEPEEASVRLEHKQYKAKQKELVRMNDLKAEVARAREQLQEQKATRADYAELEALNNDLKKRIKSQNLTIEELQAEVRYLSSKKKENNNEFYEGFDFSDFTNLDDEENPEISELKQEVKSLKIALVKEQEEKSRLQKTLELIKEILLPFASEGENIIQTIKKIGKSFFNDVDKKVKRSTEEVPFALNQASEDVMEEWIEGKKKNVQVTPELRKEAEQIEIKNSRYYKNYKNYKSPEEKNKKNFNPKF